MKAHKVIVEEAKAKKSPDQPAKTLFAPIQQTGAMAVKLYSNAFDDDTTGVFPDMADDMAKAKKSISIVGWDIDSTLELKRKSDKKSEDKDLPKDDLFKSIITAASNGVKVKILIWDTFKQFKESPQGVYGLIERLKKLPNDEYHNRIRANISIRTSHRSNMSWTHHTKMVLIDEVDKGIFYTGGLDLAKGRDEVEKWHDTHARFQGPIATDAAMLFHGRWDASGKNHSIASTVVVKEQKKILPKISKTTPMLGLGSSAGAMKRLQQTAQKQSAVAQLATSDNKTLTPAQPANFDNKTVPPTQPAMPDNKTPPATLLDLDEAQNIVPGPDIVPGPVRPRPTQQLLCSIQHAQYKGPWAFGKKKHVAEIADASVRAIKEAKESIYMESQFFSGPYMKKGKFVSSGKNPVIEALVAKIIERHQTGAPFHLYLQLPFEPVGVGEGADMDILRKNWRTIEWFIDEINKKTDGNFSQYVTLYNCGSMKEGRFQQRYTHSKLLVVDDRELIIGSANCNERSMSGTGDSETCVHMCDQPEIREFRMKLMREHFGEDNRKFYENIHHPENVAAIQATLRGNMHTLKDKSQLDDEQAKSYKKQHGDALPWRNREIHELRKDPGLPKQSGIKGRLAAYAFK